MFICNFLRTISKQAILVSILDVFTGIEPDANKVTFPLLSPSTQELSNLSYICISELKYRLLSFNIHQSKSDIGRLQEKLSLVLYNSKIDGFMPSMR